MLVSVIMATYKRPAYLKSAIESVLRQTYDNFEAVVVDDGSGDETPDVVAAFNDPRLHYVNPGHQGVLGRILNYGISKSRGELIGFCDDDDAWLETKLEKQVAYFKEHPKCGLLYANVKFFDGDGALILNERGEPLTGFDINRPPDKDHFEELLIRNYMYKPSILMRRDCFEKAGRFDDNNHFTDDYELWVRIGRTCEISGLSEPLALYRIHANNMSSGIKVMLATLQQYDMNETLCARPETKRRIRGKRIEIMYRLAKEYYNSGDLSNSGKWYSEYIRNSKDYAKIPPVIFKLLKGRLRAARTPLS